MQTVHGGLMFVMAEIAAGLVTRNDGRKYVTLDSSFRFLRGSSAKKLRGVAKITKRGKTVCFTKSQVWSRKPEGAGRGRVYVLLYGRVRQKQEKDVTVICLPGERM